MADTFMKIIVIFTSVIIVGCTGEKAFNNYARTGDTIAIAAGWQKNFNKNNIEITITPSIGADIIIPAGNPAIRASLNMYPDPVSSLVVSREVGKSQTHLANLYGLIVNGITDNDKDWYQTTVILDLPSNLPIGTSSITIENMQGDSISSSVEIISGNGVKHDFIANNSTMVNSAMLLSLERTTNYVISFNGSTIPYAIEVTLSHDADEDTGGIGKAFAINTLGHKKNITWSDNGTSMTAILTPTTETAINHIHDFKFYIAGKVENLNVTNIKAYDLNGNSVTGVTTAILQYDL